MLRFIFKREIYVDTDHSTCVPNYDSYQCHGNYWNYLPSEFYAKNDYSCSSAINKKLKKKKK